MLTKTEIIYLIEILRDIRDDYPNIYDKLDELEEAEIMLEGALRLAERTSHTVDTIAELDELILSLTIEDNNEETSNS